jgi:nickel-type superoxide dismutase maturation protease
MFRGQIPYPTRIPRRRPRGYVRRPAGQATLGIVGLVIAILAAAGLRPRLFRRVRVAGDSMLPAFRAGDRLVCGPPAWIRPGTVVAVKDPRAPDRLMVKRVHAVGPTWIEVRGDNPQASTDTRQFGPVPRSRLVGRIVYRYGPPGRTGWWPGRTAGHTR